MEFSVIEKMLFVITVASEVPNFFSKSFWLFVFVSKRCIVSLYIPLGAVSLELFFSIFCRVMCVGLSV